MSQMSGPGVPHGASDDDDLAQFGYQQRLARSMTTFTSFCLAFSMIAITGTLGPLFQPVLAEVGAVAVWYWLIALAGVIWVVLVFMHMAARIPVTGYAYQWASRIVNPYYGWIVAMIGLITFTTGATSIGALFGSVLAPELGIEPTGTNIMYLAIGALTLGFLINVFGIRIATKFNNGVAIGEIVGTIVFAFLLLVGALLFFDGGQSVSVIVDNVGAGGVDGAHVPTVNWILAATLPIFALLGWEASADLAEETHNPRKAAPKAMFRAVTVSALGGFVVMAIFIVAIPGSISAALEHPNTLFWIVEQRLGAFPAAVLKVIAFFSMMGCIVANIAVATRLIFSVSRDRMLPFSKQLAAVHPRFRTPVTASIVLWTICMVINVAGSGNIFRITAMAAVAYYFTYGTTIVGVLVGHLRGSIPEPRGAGHFGLGRWTVPVCAIALVWCFGVAAAYLIPSENHYVVKYFLFALAIGLLFTAHAWWALRTGRASVPLRPDDAAAARDRADAAAEQVMLHG